FHPPMRLPRLVIFHSKKIETSNAAQYLNLKLPPAFQKLRLCRHYHSDMSPDHLQETYDSFADPDGLTLILHATSGAGEGLDIPDIDGVIIYGLPDTITQLFQWLGRAGRSSIRDAFALMMVEPWVFEMDLSAVVDDPDDPDCPVLPEGTKKKNPRKNECIGVACVHLATCTDCKRSAFTKFFEDDSVDG
ncbi:P-loop containing nucleoside triphosphate hydrolase protein, partial [Mycena galopus ATCC 62051]